MPWDIQIYGNLWWNLRLRTVTEYHGGPKCLTRVRLTYFPVVTTVLVNAIAAPVLLYRHFFTHADRHHPWGLVLYALFLLFLFLQGFPAETARGRPRGKRRAQVRAGARYQGKPNLKRPTPVRWKTQNDGRHHRSFAASGLAPAQAGVAPADRRPESA